MRDITERQRSLDFILWQYKNNVSPATRQYVLPSKRYADLVLESNADLPALEKSVYDAIEEIKRTTGDVLDNQATAIPLVLNGASHTVTVPLNLVAWNLTPSSKVTLQLTDASDLFFAQQAVGLVSLQAKLTLATSP